MTNDGPFIEMVSGAYKVGLASIVGFGLGVAEGYVSQSGGDPLALDIALGAMPLVGAFGGFQIGHGQYADHEPLDTMVGGLYGLGSAAIVGGAELAGYGAGCLAYNLFN